MDSNQEEAETSSDQSTGENELEQTVSEDAKTPEPKPIEDRYDELVIANRKEREKRRRLESQLKSIQPPQDLTEEGTGVDMRDLQMAKTNAYIARMVSTDPTFRDRLDRVEEFVKQGYDVEEADEKALASLMRDVLKEAKTTPEKSNKPSKTETAATTEEEAPSGVSYKDISSGKDKSIEAQKMKQAMDAYGA